MKTRFYLSSLVTVLLVLLMMTGASSQAIWSTPIRLSENGFSSWFPDVYADAFGDVHVVWSSTLFDYDVVMYTSSRDGETWKAANDIMALEQTEGSAVTRPILVVDRTGRLHLTFKYNHTRYSNAFLVDPEKAANWKPPILISDPSQLAYFSQMAVDGNDSIHMLLSWNMPTEKCRICFQLFYRASDDHGLTWSEPKALSPLGVGVAKPQLLVDRKNNLHAVWEVGTGGALGNVTSPVSIMYTVSYSGGENWERVVRFDAKTQDYLNPAIGQDSAGNIVITALDTREDRVVYLVSNDEGRSWSQPAQIENVWGSYSVYATRLDDYDLATDSAGLLHMVMVGRLTEEDTSLNVLHLTWDGESWSAPEVIASYEGDAPEWTRISIGNGNILNVVWFLRDEAHLWDTENGQYSIWYSRSVSQAPFVASLPVPTIVPTPRPTETVEVTIVPTPSPTLIIPTFAEREGKRLVYNELDYLWVALLVSIPVIAFIGLVFLVKRIRRG